MLYAVIIAGGAGKRLWPKSKRDFPKFLFKTNGKKSLLKITMERIRPLVRMDNIIIVTHRDHVRFIKGELPDLPKDNIIAEPVSKNTAAAISVACSFIRKRDTDGIAIVMPADHIIEPPTKIKEIFYLASLIAGMKRAIITIGIRPEFAATGYGYIKRGRLYKRLVSKRPYDVYKVNKFIEKPVLKKAKQFLKSKIYLWNSGIFIAKAQVFLDEFKRFQPRIYSAANKIQKGLGTKRQEYFLRRYYKSFPPISIDYAVMEKTDIAYVIKADVDWQDVGSWQSLGNYLKKDSRGNIVMADHIGIDTEDSTIIGEKKHMIATLGLSNIVIVHTEAATLVCSKDKAEHVKRVVEALQKNKLLWRYI